MSDIGSWVGGLASKVWEPQKGLPFGSYLHTPPRRRRRLTGPPDRSQDSLWHRIQVLSSSEREQQNYHQEQCGFLSVLPLDVRMIIYDMVFGGMMFHIGLEPEPKNRILTHICLRPDATSDDNHQYCLAPTHKRPSSAPRDDYPQATGLLPLLVTCRRIYSEAIDVLYSANTFDFWQNRAVWHFLKVMLPQERLRSIRRFRWAMQIPHHPSVSNRSTRDWSDLFTFFSNETCGLQHLYIKLNRNHPFEAVIEQTPDGDAASWIQPMVVMALDANRKRGCKTEIVTNNVVHDLVEIFKATAQANKGSPENRVLARTCAEIHRRMRLSYDCNG
jgi:hypothetical protein